LHLVRAGAPVRSRPRRSFRISLRRRVPQAGIQHGPLYERLAVARAQGYALVDEEFEFGLVGAAAPVRDFRGQIVAALNVSAPKFRLGERLETAGKKVKRAADELSVLLGWSSDPQLGVVDSSRPS
jgi:DNA-binding IclR family transcriptional regulator